MSDIKELLNIDKSLEMLLLIASTSPFVLPTKPVPRLVNDYFYEFIPLNFNKYTDVNVYVQDEEFNYRKINSSYANTNNILVRVLERFGICNDASYDYLRQEDVEEEKYYYYIIDMDTFNKLPKKIKNNSIFEFEHTDKKPDKRNSVIMTPLCVNTYEWSSCISKKEYIAYNIYHLLYTGDAITLDNTVNVLLKTLKRLYPIDVFDLNAPIFDDDQIICDDGEFIDDDGNRLVDLDGNKLKHPIDIKPYIGEKDHDSIIKKLLAQK